MAQNVSTQLLPNVATPTVVGTTPVQVAFPNSSRSTLWVYNPSGTVTLAIAPVGTTPVVNGSGSVTLPPLTGIALGGPNDYAFTAGCMAVASVGGANPITVWEW